MDDHIGLSDYFGQCCGFHNDAYEVYVLLENLFQNRLFLENIPPVVVEVFSNLQEKTLVLVVNLPKLMRGIFAPMN
mgnify:CR=1 FL=1